MSPDLEDNVPIAIEYRYTRQSSVDEISYHGYGDGEFGYGSGADGDGGLRYKEDAQYCSQCGSCHFEPDNEMPFQIS